MLKRGKMDRDVVEIVGIDSLVPKEHLLRKIDKAMDFSLTGETETILTQKRFQILGEICHLCSGIGFIHAQTSYLSCR